VQISLKETKRKHHETTVPKKTTWCTPKHVLQRYGPFVFDPCPNPKHPLRCAPAYTLDGLRSWNQYAGQGVVFVNPPFGKDVDLWLSRGVNDGCDCLFLLPARVETRWFRKYVWDQASGILFFYQRIQYVDPDTMEPTSGAGFPSCLVAFGNDALARLVRYDDVDGKVVML